MAAVEIGLGVEVGGCWNAMMHPMLISASPRYSRLHSPAHLFYPLPITIIKHIHPGHRVVQGSIYKGILLLLLQFFHGINIFNFKNEKSQNIIFAK